MLQDINYFKIPALGFDSFVANNLSEQVQVAENNPDNMEVKNLKKNVKKLEGDIHYLEKEHATVLSGLQNQIDHLREDNQELQFQLVMRTHRTLESDNIGPGHFLTTVPFTEDPQINNTEAVTNNIMKLRKALEEEKVKNNELLKRLKLLEDSKKKSESIEEASKSAPNEETSIEISSKLRITLNPLKVALFNEELGIFMVRNKPTIDECQDVIKALLEQRETSKTQKAEVNIERRVTELNEVSTVKQRPLLNVKHKLSKSNMTTGVGKLNPVLANPVNTKNVGDLKLISSHHRVLTPILPSKIDTSVICGKEEDKKCQMNENSECLTSRSSTSNNRRGMTNSSGLNTTLSSSSLIQEPKLQLPALPTSNEFNQADKQRRLKILQKKRLYNLQNKF